jgi:hypothetical protein
MNPRHICALILLLLTLSSLRLTALGQETRATLSGTVTDSNQAAIAGVTLQLTNVDTNTTSSTQSNDVGQYHFFFLNPGNYKLSAQAAGFQTLVRQGIQLNVSQEANIDLTLNVGSQSQTVTVAGSAPLLETEKADRGLVISQRNLSELPITTRNPVVLAELTPGVTNTGQSYNLTPFSNSGNSSWSINGSAANGTEYLLDGAPNDMIYQSVNSIAYVPLVDAVEEFKVITAPYDAQYGRNGGGVISIVTKSGTNTFHGTAYEFLERPFLNANTWTNNATGHARSDTTLDEFGAAVGGPVLIPKVYDGKNRTFFFVGWEGYLQNINLSTVISVPTQAQRQGDFSQTKNGNGQLITIYDPASGHLVGNNWVRSPFPGNIIPANRIDPVGQTLANSYPLPNTNQQAAVNWQNNFFPANNITWYHFYNTIGRIDHNFSEREKVYARFAWNNQLLSQNSNEVPGNAADQRYGTKINDDFVIDSITILNTNTILDTRGSLTRWVQNYKPQNYGAFDASEIGWPQSLTTKLPAPQRFPYITATGYYQYLGNSSSNIWWAPTTAINLAPTLTLVRGRHTIKTGLDYRWTRFSTFQGAYGGGTFALTPGFTQSNYATADSLSGNPIASLLLGDAASGEVDYLPSPDYSWKYWAPWVQDDIKLTSKLTVNVGVRWEVQVPVIERHNYLNRGFQTTAVNPISAQINQAQFPGYQVYGGLGFVNTGGNGRSPFNIDWNNVQPRVGAAYRLTNTTVLRGGFGTFFVPQFSTASNFGFSQVTPFVATNNGGETAANVLSNPFPSGIALPQGSTAGLKTLLGGAPSFSDPSGQIGRVSSFSFGFQHQLPARLSLDLSYAGTRSVGQPISRAIDALSAANLALGNSALGGSATYLNAQVPNPFQGLLPGTSLNGATITRQQSLLPFPEFTSVSENDHPVGKVWYNALELTVMQQQWHNLTLTGTYTFSKNTQALSYLNAQDANPSDATVPWDRTHRLVLAPIYDLPFGPGKQFFGSTNGVVSRLIGGWQTMMVYTWQTGAPMTAPPALPTLLTSGVPQAPTAPLSNLVSVIGKYKLPNPSWNHMFNSGLVEANGTVVDTINGLAPAFQVQPAFAPRTIPLYFGNLRDRWGNEFQITLAKNTRIRENMNLQIRAEAFNAFNHPIFGGDPIINPTSPQFGQLIRSNGQSNIPRTIQLAARFIF